MLHICIFAKFQRSRTIHDKCGKSIKSAITMGKNMLMLNDWGGGGCGGNGSGFGGSSIGNNERGSRIGGRVAASAVVVAIVVVVAAGAAEVVQAAVIIITNRT